MSYQIRPATPQDHDALFEAFSVIVDSKEGFPQQPPVSRSDFHDYWIAHSSAVHLVMAEDGVVGAYYLKPNFVGRAAHIANAGYFVRPPSRGRGIGRALVEHSMKEARGLGYDAMQFNLVFESNPARAMYRALGFQEIGRIPAAVDGEDAVIFWRSLEGVPL
ncbi:MAG TPA: GNAT family N-acetyltransferase [Acidimicrobiales bacterium]|nr:GNAT family N-acetyltransferase [Acidimicrobiales bacterium]